MSVHGYRRHVRPSVLVASVLVLGACGGDVTLESDDASSGGRSTDTRGSSRPGPSGNDDIADSPDDTDDRADDTRAVPDAPVADAAAPSDSGDTSTQDVPSTETDTGIIPPSDTPEDPFNCGEISGNAEPVPAPIDLMFVIDTSGSMDEEIEQIETNLNALTDFITTSGLDIQVIMFGNSSQICPPAPLTDGSCPPTDSDGYKVVNVTVNSTDSLELLRDNYSSGANYSALFREGSIRHVVFVTDDEAEGVTASRYRTWADTLPPPGMLYDIYYHAIVSLEETESCFLFICDTEGCDGAYGAAVAEGAEYRELVRISGGVESSICDADWSAILDGIAERIVETSQVPCTYGLPESTRPGEVIDPTTIRVEYTEGGVTRAIPEVSSAESCGAGGWYYEDPAMPETIRLCPASCTEATESIRIIGECRKQ